MSIKVIQSQPKGSVIFTSSQNWTVPLGVNRIKIIAIGGGGGGGGGYSSTYTGGGGGSGAIAYTEMMVSPGDELQIQIGAGGTGGAGGSSPAAGTGGGNTYVMPSGVNGSVCAANGGAPGGPASSTANGGNGNGGAPGGVIPPVIGGFGMNGTNGQNTNPALTPVLPLGTTVSSTGLVTITYGGGPWQAGVGGPGGAVNSNGGNGQPGMVYIWWGGD